MQQLHAEPGLQPRNAFSDRGPGDAERLRGRRKAAVIDGGHEFANSGETVIHR